MGPSEIKPHAEFDEPLRFERLLAEISTFFINLPADRIDSRIEAAQHRVCEFLDLDRSTLFQMPEGELGSLLLTHIHQPAGSRPPSEQMSLREFFPRTLQKILSSARSDSGLSRSNAGLQIHFARYELNSNNWCDTQNQTNKEGRQ